MIINLYYIYLRYLFYLYLLNNIFLILFIIYLRYIFTFNLRRLCRRNLFIMRLLLICLLFFVGISYWIYIFYLFYWNIFMGMLTFLRLCWIVLRFGLNLGLFIILLIFMGNCYIFFYLFSLIGLRLIFLMLLLWNLMLLLSDSLGVKGHCLRITYHLR